MCCAMLRVSLLVWVYWEVYWSRSKMYCKMLQAQCNKINVVIKNNNSINRFQRIHLAVPPGLPLCYLTVAEVVWEQNKLCFCFCFYR